MWKVSPYPINKLTDITDCYLAFISPFLRWSTFLFKNPPLPQSGEIQIIEFSGQADSIYFWIRVFLDLRKLHPNQISFNEKEVLQNHVTDTVRS